MRLKEVVQKWYYNNSSELNRTLFESTLAPEVVSALSDWIKNSKNSGVLIGGMALSYHAIPRYTSDIDVIYLSENDVPKMVQGFKKTRSHAFTHVQTGVEIKILTPEFLKIPRELVQAIVKTSASSNGLQIASKSGLITLKLYRKSRRDQADISDLIRSGDIDLKPFIKWIAPEDMNLYKEIEKNP